MGQGINTEAPGPDVLEGTTLGWLGEKRFAMCVVTSEGAQASELRGKKSTFQEAGPRPASAPRGSRQALSGSATPLPQANPGLSVGQGRPVTLSEGNILARRNPRKRLTGPGTRRGVRASDRLFPFCLL